MRGLLMKDCCVLLRQMRLFLALIVLFAVMPGDLMFSFAIVYAAMLPKTVLAYDERSKWDQMAAMMPYRRRDLVLSKYLLGYLFMAGSAGLTLVVRLVKALLAGTAITAELPVTVLTVLCGAVLLQSFSMPLLFHFGVEKGRLAFALVFGLLFAVFVVAGEDLLALVNGSGKPLFAGLLVFTIAAAFLSQKLSERFYVRA